LHDNNTISYIPILCRWQ